MAKPNITKATNVPYIQIAQSTLCVPPTDTLSLSLDIKILPDSVETNNPFYGIWLLDVSGSMVGERIENAKTSLLQQIDSLPNGTIFNLILFESRVKYLVKNEIIDNKSRGKISKVIKKIQAEGGTAFYNALEEAIDRIQKYKGQLTKKIIMISDGEPGDVPVELGKENDPNYQRYFMMARTALENGASIDTVGALGEHNVYLMYEIAKASTGKYIFAETAEELQEKMTIASEQTTNVIYDQPTLTILPNDANIEINDAVQYKPTIIRMPFEKIKGVVHKAWLRSFESGDTYQILLKVTLKLDMQKITREGDNKLLDLNFNFGKNLDATFPIVVKFSEVSANHKINPQVNKQYANLFGQAEEIKDQTIKNNAAATQRIQGDETKKIN